jgi:hypothetical protein
MTSSIPVVAVLHGPDAAASSREIVAASKGICDVVLVFRDSDVLESPSQFRVASSLCRTTVTSDPWMADLVRDIRWDGVTTFLDREVQVVDHLAGINSLSVWDKFVQRDLLRDRGLETTRAEPVDNAGDFVRAAEHIGLPGVLKQRRGVSGIGVRFVRDSSDVKREIESRGDWANMLFEEFIEPGAHPSGLGWLGDYVSIETVSTGTDRIHVAVFDKFPLSVSQQDGSDLDYTVRESGNVYPSRLPPEVRRELLRTTSGVLDALEITWRVTHTEMRLSDSGARLIEVNGRPGGLVTQMLKTAGGVDTVKAALQLALHQEPSDIETSGVKRAAAYIDMSFPNRAGSVLSDVARRTVLKMPGVVRVDQLAKQGESRKVTNYRAVGVFVEAETISDLDQLVFGTVEKLATAFNRDGLLQHPLRQAIELRR